MPYLPDTLPKEYLARMRMLLGDGYGDYVAALSDPPVRALRVNTLKTDIDAALRLLPWHMAPSGAMRESFVLTDAVEHIGSHPYHMAGLFYMQEPSAARAVDVLDPLPGMRILDMCAAPGGKAGAIAARMAGLGVLVANEPVMSRAGVLYRNLQRPGVANAMVTSARPEAIAVSMTGFFDMVLVDAPCSGEGMFRKSAAAVTDWSPAHVCACAQRQRAILDSAAECVKPGGSLVYSTCTFSREENECVAEAFDGSHEEFELCSMERLYPHTSIGEGQFIALLRRGGAGKNTAAGPLRLPLADKALWPAFSDDVLLKELPGAACAAGDRVYIVGDGYPQPGKGVRVLGCGVEAARIVGARLEPEHALFMAAGVTPRRAVELRCGDAALGRYLSGDTVAVSEELRGWCSVNAGGYPVGFGKAVDGTLKNKLPKGLRINNYTERNEEL